MFFFNQVPQMNGCQGQWYMIPVVCSGNNEIYTNLPNMIINESYASLQNSQITTQKTASDIENNSSNFQCQQQRLEFQEKGSLEGGCSKREKKLKNENRVKSDEEFKPYAAVQKRKRKNPQNLNRNVAPNIIHQIFSFLQKKSKSQPLVERLLEAQPEKNSGSAKRFYLYQALIRDRMHHYVNIQSLQIFASLQDPSCELYGREEQLLYMRISRILISIFLKREFQCIILTSKRVNSQKKLDHLEYRRKILEEIQQFYIR